MNSGYSLFLSSLFFFFNDTATTEIYTLSLHDALPICPRCASRAGPGHVRRSWRRDPRSEEHTSELQSPGDLVCRLLLEKKKKKKEGRLRCINLNTNTNKIQKKKTK